MSDGPKYKFGDEYLTKLEIIQRAYDRANTYDDLKTRKSYIRTIEKQLSGEISSTQMKNKIASIYLPIFSTIIIIIVLVFILFFPLPSAFQSTVVWILFSLACAAVAAFIPGFIEVRFQNWLRAGGAIAVFIVMYFFIPKITKIQNLNNQQEKISLYIARLDTVSLEKIEIDFNPHSSASVVEHTCKRLQEYYGITFTPSDFICYRKSDGKIYSDENCQQIMQDKSLMLISSSLVLKYPDKRQAYLHFKGLFEKQ